VAQVLVALASRLDAKEVAELAATLSQTLATIHLEEAKTRLRDPSVQLSLAHSLWYVANLLEPKEAVTLLLQPLSKTPPGWSQERLTEGLTAVAARLGPQEAPAAATLLRQAMTRTSDPATLGQLAQALATAAIRLEPKEAAQVFGQTPALLKQALSKPMPPTHQGLLGKGLSALASRLEAKEAAALLGQAMTGTSDPQNLQHLAQGLAAMAIRLEAKEAARESGRAAVLLTQAMTRTSNLYSLQYLAQGLTAVAVHLEPKEAREAAALLGQAMTGTSDPHILRFLAQGLEAVAVRLEPKEAARVRGQAAGLLTQVMTRNLKLIIFFEGWTQGLALPPRLDPKEVAAEAARHCNVISQAKPGELGRVMASPLTLAALYRYLDEKEAAKFAATLLEEMSKRQGIGDLKLLAETLAKMAAWMEPGEAARRTGQAAAILSEAMCKERNAMTLHYATETLAKVANRMEHREAVQVCSRVAAHLSETLSKEPGHRGNVYYLEKSLEALVTRLGPREAVRICGQAGLARALPAVLSGEAPIASRQRLEAVAHGVFGLSEPGTLFVTPALLQPALQPPPTVSTQVLVELLKQPLCVGTTRDLVLKQLEKRYGRPFADQWDFVRFVRQHNLDLDLTSPAQPLESLALE